MYCGKPENINNSAVMYLESFGDGMHNFGGHMKHIILERFARISASSRAYLLRRLKSSNLYNTSKMRFSDWIYLGVSLCDERTYPEISDAERAHMRAVVDLRGHVYASLNNDRTIGGGSWAVV